MGTPKWQGKAGLARTADAVSEANPQVYPLADTINAEGVPVSYERVTSQKPDIFHIEQSGYDWSVTVDGMQASCFDFGYLMWLALGGDSFLTDTHTITPTDNSQYFNLKIDRGLTLDGNGPTQSIKGCRIGAISLEQPLRDYAKVSVSGLACAMNQTEGGTLSVTIPEGDDDQPLSWAALAHASGFFKIGYNGAAATQDDDIQGWKFELTREQIYAGIDLGASQPEAINEGGRELTAEVTKEFIGAGAQNAYKAWKDTEKVELDVRYQVGANYYRIQIPQMEVVGAFGGEIGTGNESIMGVLSLKATKKAATNIMTITTLDGSAGAYT